MEKAESQGQRLSSYASSSSSTTNKFVYGEEQKHSISTNDPTKLNYSPHKFSYTSSDWQQSALQNISATQENQVCSSAPTLPLHSPHSPLHPHAQSHQHNKLSARYINNKLRTRFSSKSEQLTPTSPQDCGTWTGKDTIITSLKYDHTTACENQNSIVGDVNTATATADKLAQSETIVEAILSQPPSPSASKLICSCENENPRFGLPSKSNKTSKLECGIIHLSNKERSHTILNTKVSEDQTSEIPVSGSAKRLVATRNAATSPNLDLRKLSNVMTVSAKVTRTRCNRDNSVENEPITIPNKLGLEKSNSLGESKPQKQLRNTRSLSPRPPVRHQQPLIPTDEKEIISVKLTPPSVFGYDSKFVKDPSSNSAKGKGKSQRKMTVNSRSEQTSPNITDLSEEKFNYNQTNKSTSCLDFIPMDPWMKMDNLENISCAIDSSQKNKNLPIKSKHLSTESKWDRLKSSGFQQMNNGLDPWVKRSENSISKSPKHERFHQAKSYSASTFIVEGSNKKKHVIRQQFQLQRCKSPLLSSDDIILPLQSAPSSPHFLNTPENPFASAFSLTLSHGEEATSPTRSVSFSPARVKDHRNPFTDSMTASVIPNSPPPFISVAAQVDAMQQQYQVFPPINHGFLNACNPNLLLARHSFSSVSNQQHEDELQLNIRRLSEQMRKTNNYIGDAVKVSLSDRNVNENHNAKGNISSTQTKTYGADFSDYLKQFRCSEAKKAAAALNVMTPQGKPFSPLNDATSGCANLSTMSSLTDHKTKMQSDSLLETTC